MPLKGEAKKIYQREYMRRKRELLKHKERERKREDRKRAREAMLLGVTAIMSSTDVRAMRQAGIKPEDIKNEAGKVSSRIYYALLRDRDAIKAHLSWHEEQIGRPDIGTILEQHLDMIKQLQAQVNEHAARITLLEANQVVREYSWEI